MEKTADERMPELEAEFGREQLLKLAHSWVWVELWFAYSRAKQKGLLSIWLPSLLRRSARWTAPTIRRASPSATGSRRPD
jgi:hypothetical protein